MKRIAMFALALCLMSASAFAGDGRNWTVQPAGTWTSTDNVNVSYFFKEAGVQLGSAQLLIGPLLPGQDRPVDGGEFVGSGRTICLNAEAFRADEPTAVAVAAESCFRFPFGPLDPPTLLTP